MNKKWALCFIFSVPVWSHAGNKTWSGDSELSYVQARGNTISDTLQFKQSLVYQVDPWTNTLKLEASNVSSEQQDKATGVSVFSRTGERYYLTEQADLAMTELTYVFGRGTYEKQRFSGFDNKETVVLGLGHFLVKNDSVNLKLEVGAGQSSDKYSSCHIAVCDPDVPYDQRDSSFLGYFSELVTWQLSDKAEFGQDVSVEDSAANRVTRFHIYVKSELINNLSMKLGYMAKYTDAVPADKQRLDEETSASLMYSF